MTKAYRVCRIYGEIYQIENNILRFKGYIGTNNGPKMVKYDGAWWLQYGDSGLKKKDYKIEIYEKPKSIIIEAMGHETAQYWPDDVIMGRWLDQIKELEVLLK